MYVFHRENLETYPHINARSIKNRFCLLLLILRFQTEDRIDSAFKVLGNTDLSVRFTKRQNFEHSKQI